MAAAFIQEDELAMSIDELVRAQLELYHHCFAFVKSLALKAATDLRIPDAIHRCGGAATLSDLAAETRIHPTKLSNLRRLMRVLTTSGVFSVVDQAASDAADGDSDAAVYYRLTRVSRLLVSSSRHHLSPMVGVLVDPLAVTALSGMREWFNDERAVASSLFEAAHGCARWEMTAKDAADGCAFNAGMAADSRVTMEILLRERSGVFDAVGISSLVDVGGAHGAAAAAVAKAFPHLKCTVLDLPHVVAGAPADENLTFVAGDMFEYIPPADAVLLKWILHDWPDEDCVKILRRCKEAIPAKGAGGKVIIIDMVVGSAGSQDIVSKEMEVLFDVFIMYLDGIEREEHEWRKIFLEAGFSDYKIIPLMGVRSIIEVYP